MAEALYYALLAFAIAYSAYLAYTLAKPYIGNMYNKYKNWKNRWKKRIKRWFGKNKPWIKRIIALSLLASRYVYEGYKRAKEIARAWVKALAPPEPLEWRRRD